MLREELEDLLNYLNGLPDEVRRAGAFTAYEQRVGELSRELVLTDMQLRLHLPSMILGGPAEMSEYGRMYHDLSVLTRRYEHVAERSQMASRAIQWGVVVASAGSVLAVLKTANALVLPFSGAAASLAVFFASWLVERTRKQERAATRLSALREEIAHSFGPAGQVLRPSEYYAASTKRIESLLDEINLTVGSGKSSKKHSATPTAGARQ
jgi:hypothetical protein